MSEWINEQKLVFLIPPLKDQYSNSAVFYKQQESRQLLQTAESLANWSKNEETSHDPRNRGCETMMWG